MKSICKDHAGRRVFAQAVNSLVVASFLFFTSAAMASDNGYEQPGEYKASAILTPELRKGANHTVDELVRHDGFYYLYSVQSPFGAYLVSSTNGLNTLIRELDAIAAMRQVKTEDTVLASVKSSGEKTVTGLKNLFNDPQATLEGAAGGVGSLFNRASTYGDRKVTAAEDSRFEQFVGISKSKGLIATRYGVNVYSLNKPLQDELDRLGQADYMGGIGVGLATSVVPGAGGLILSASGTARLLNEAINTTPGSELWLRNKNKLLAMGVDEDLVDLFLNNPVITPTLATVMVTALEAMDGVANRTLPVKVALQANTPETARMIAEMTVMAAGYHMNVAPVRGFAPMARLFRTEKKDGGAVILLPTDYVIWSEKVASVAAGIVQQSKAAGSSEIWTLGTFSDQAQRGLKEQGWQIHEQARSSLIKNEM